MRKLNVLVLNRRVRGFRPAAGASAADAECKYGAV